MNNDKTPRIVTVIMENKTRITQFSDDSYLVYNSSDKLLTVYNVDSETRGVSSDGIETNVTRLELEEILSPLISINDFEAAVSTIKNLYSK
ncbi:Uncharacterised protein [Candidatus Tiddalikarchaeum anstoanum]|nr:Uncharacterised protein [Candidatus Tiddalikarchaeum anstoanum]